MTDSTEIFLRGAKAYRNLRDFAKQQRDHEIQRANEAFQSTQQPPQSISSDDFESAQSSQDDSGSECSLPWKRSHIDQSASYLF